MELLFKREQTSGKMGRSISSFGASLKSAKTNRRSSTDTASMN